MAIKSSTFGRVERSRRGAFCSTNQRKRTQAHKLALAALARGREIREKISKGGHC